MRKFKNISLTGKQAYGFGLILFIMALVNFYTIYKMSTIKNSIDQITQNRLPGMILISEINSNTSSFRITELQHAAAGTEEGMLEYEQQMKDILEVIQDNYQEYENYIVSQEEKNYYTDIKEEWGKYLEYNKEFLRFSRIKMKEEAIFLLNGEARILFDDLSDDLQELTYLSKQSSLDAATQANTIYSATRTVIILLIIFTFAISIVLLLLIVRAIVGPVRKLEEAVKKVAAGDDTEEIIVRTKDEIGNLSIAFNQMLQTLRDAKSKNQKQDWLKTGQNQLNEQIRGDMDTTQMAYRVVRYLAGYLDAQIGAIYVHSEKKKLQLLGSYAFNKRKELNSVITIGEGIVGQAALERQVISITEVPEDYIRIHSGLGNTIPRNIVAAPFFYEEELGGVIELGSIKEFSDEKLEFLYLVLENIAIAFHSAKTNNRIKALLAESRRQAAELQTQQEELKASNEELEAQTNALKESEAALQAQQEELRATNEELEEKTRYLERQKKEITEKNDELEIVRKEIEQKAKELEASSRYKSEFLANMSHELRTPLNSLLILARNLYENRENNLSEDQVESAKIIHKSGKDLLLLINDILDLSKIEAGKMSLNIEKIELSEILRDIENTFKHLAEEKGLKLVVQIDEDLPRHIATDIQRLEQVIKNLISNAIKFTSKGEIRLSCFQPPASINLSESKLQHENALAIDVTDTGIGIPPGKQRAIFEAFQQADGSTSRKYGGTGLGLSISKQICKLLGGELQLKSEVNKGSSFTIYIPFDSGKKDDISKSKTKDITQKPPPQIVKQIPIIKREEQVEPPQDIKELYNKLPDDRTTLSEIDTVILVIEDDLIFAKMLYNQCKGKGFKCLVAVSGEEGLELANRYKPAAIILDIKLPGITGWEVLDSLKENPALRHIPVHMMSATEASFEALNKGAIGFLSKPVEKEDMDDAFSRIEGILDKKIKDLLVIEDDKKMRKAIVKLIGNGDVKSTETASGQEAIEQLKAKKFDCVVLDLGLPDMTGIELLNILSRDKNIDVPPVIVYTGKELSHEEHLQLQKYADSIIIKGVKSEERLLDETALFLHRIVDKMPSEKQQVIVNLHDKDSMFHGKKILLVDDDMRNVFALSKILSEKGMKVIKAENGKKAIQIIEKEKDINLVLMDIMMPVMDGYEAIKYIRSKNELKKLPVIALTAKAMKEDREKCIAVGASDYLTKPVDMDRLFSMMRVWLYN